MKTINKTIEIEGRFVRQMSSVCKYAVVRFRLEPSEIEDIEFKTDMDLTNITSAPQWIEGIKKGIYEFCKVEEIGYFSVTLIDLLEHTVDSTEHSYTIATCIALNDAISNHGVERSIF